MLAVKLLLCVALLAQQAVSIPPIQNNAIMYEEVQNATLVAIPEEPPKIETSPVALEQTTTSEVPPTPPAEVVTESSSPSSTSEAAATTETTTIPSTTTTAAAVESTTPLIVAPRKISRKFKFRTTTESSLRRKGDLFETKVNEVAGVGCELCLKAVYGINYNVIRLKKAAEDMVRLDCEALFHDQPQDIARCIRLMVEKIEEYYAKVEPVLDTRNVCVKLRMCAPQQRKSSRRQNWLNLL